MFTRLDKNVMQARCFVQQEKKLFLDLCYMCIEVYQHVCV